MEAPSEDEMKRVMESIDAKLALPPAEFEKWANEVLDRSHKHYVERRRRRRSA